MNSNSMKREDFHWKTSNCSRRTSQSVNGVRSQPKKNHLDRDIERREKTMIIVDKEYWQSNRRLFVFLLTFRISNEFCRCLSIKTKPNNLAQYSWKLVKQFNRSSRQYINRRWRWFFIEIEHWTVKSSVIFLIWPIGSSNLTRKKK